jgi:hypothetical protein
MLSKVPTRPLLQVEYCLRTASTMRNDDNIQREVRQVSELYNVRRFPCLFSSSSRYLLLVRDAPDGLHHARQPHRHREKPWKSIQSGSKITKKKQLAPPEFSYAPTFTMHADDGPCRCPQPTPSLNHHHLCPAPTLTSPCNPSIPICCRVFCYNLVLPPISPKPPSTPNALLVIFSRHAKSTAETLRLPVRCGGSRRH